MSMGLGAPVLLLQLRNTVPSYCLEGAISEPAGWWHLCGLLHPLESYALFGSVVALGLVTPVAYRLFAGRPNPLGDVARSEGGVER
jgi:hypothetical protein